MAHIEIFSQPTSHKRSVILAFIGAVLAGGGQILPLSRARNSGPHSRARAKERIFPMLSETLHWVELYF